MKTIHVEMHIEVARSIAAAIITQPGMTTEQAQAIIALKRTLRRHVREHDAAIEFARNAPRSSLDQFI